MQIFMFDSPVPALPPPPPPPVQGAEGEQIRWLQDSVRDVYLCLQVGATTGPPEAQLRNDARITL